MALSLEGEISAIEKDYMQARSMLYNMSQSKSYGGDFEYGQLEYVNKTIKAVLAFQRRVELLYEDVTKMYDDKVRRYFERCADNVTSLRFAIRDTFTSKGIIHGILSLIDEKKYQQAFESFKRIRSKMYAFLEDVRMIYAIRIYPIEEKIALKSQLSNYGFVEVVKCLDEAENNLAMRKPAHLKDCVDRSRESLEKLTASMLMTLKKKPSGYFATDIGTLSGLGVIDKESKRLIDATYSYLSEVGAHGRAGEVTLGDAHYAMKETYMRIDILLKKYAAYLAGKK